MTFKTSLDKTAMGVTTAITILFAAIIIGQILMIKEEVRAFPIFISVFLFLIYFGTFLFRPINYILTNDELIIHRTFKDIIIDRNKISSVEILDKEKLKGTIRTFGVGGLFGYWGSFANAKIGPMTWYATRRNNSVLIKTINNNKIVLTPNEPEKFIAVLKGINDTISPH